MRQKNRGRRAFTLVELLVVIVILSLLAAFMGGNVVKYIAKAKKDLVRPRMAVIEGALDRFHIDCQRYPDDSEGLDILVVDPGNIEGYAGPYLKKSEILDPWGRPFVYAAQGVINPGSYDLMCYGADGQPDGEGENADVVNE